MSHTEHRAWLKKGMDDLTKRQGERAPPVLYPEVNKVKETKETKP